MVTWNRTVPAVLLLGLVLGSGCGRDLTEPVIERPEFVLLEPGTVTQVSVRRRRQRTRSRK